MPNKTNPDPAKLQRLVDGELTVDETRELLETAEQNPEHWRVIACQFAENQLFHQQFSKLAEGTTAPQSTKKPVSPVEAHSSANSKAVLTIHQLAIAASLAVAGLIGYLVGSDGPMANISDLPVDSNAIANIDPVQSNVTPVELKPEYRMELLTPDGESINGEVDLYRSDDIQRFVNHGQNGNKGSFSLSDVLPPSGITSETRQRLSQSGYEINESTNYMSGRLQDGRKFVVPVRSIRFDQGH